MASFSKKGVTAQAINSESLAAAALDGRDLWTKAKTGKHQVLLFGPKTIVTKELEDFVSDPSARLQIGYFVVDEIHLVDEQGPELSMPSCSLFGKNYLNGLFSLASLRRWSPASTET